jgi:hypothetical protein
MSSSSGEEGSSVEHLRHVVIEEEATNSHYPCADYQLMLPLCRSPHHATPAHTWRRWWGRPSMYLEAWKGEGEGEKGPGRGGTWRRGGQIRGFVASSVARSTRAAAIFRHEQSERWALRPLVSWEKMSCDSVRPERWEMSEVKSVVVSWIDERTWEMRDKCWLQLLFRESMSEQMRDKCCSLCFVNRLTEQTEPR